MQSEQINEIATALAKAQGQIQNPVKNCTVKVRTKAGSDYTFKYADLTAVVDVIKKPLSDNGIFYTQYVEIVDERYRLTTKLIHNSGQYISATNPLFVSDQTSQAFGSAVTFMKRYALCGILGISADIDDDANVAEGNRFQFNGGKSVAEKYGTVAADIVEHEVAYNEQGEPVDNIPHGDPHIEKLRTMSARKEHEELQKEMLMCSSLVQLRKWANLSQTKDRVQSLPDINQARLRDLFEGKKKELAFAAVQE